MTTLSDTITSTTAETQPDVDTAAAEEFAERLIGVFNDGAISLLLSIGHQLGLFDRLAELPPSTSPQIASAAGLQERYVREWLNGLTVAGVVEHDPEHATYWLPAEHAASLTTAAGPGNLARMMQLVPVLGTVEQDILECFVRGGGLGYEAFPRFHHLMAEESAAAHDAGLLELVVPLVPGLAEGLTAGARLADVGCGSGHAINMLARAFPASRFVGYDFSEEALEAARREAADWGVSNAEFVLQDVAALDVPGQYDFVTAFDAIHDQAHPGTVLANIARALRPGGTFLMVDIQASSHVHENVEVPWAAFLYTVSLMHCMTVSLAYDGDGLGTVWGQQTATRMLGDAGFTDIEVHHVETDPFNSFYLARKA